MKIQKLLTLLITLPLLAGCGEEPTHEHTFKSEWSFNESVHYHEATCGHDVKGSYGEHNIEDGVCTVCGYEVAHVHTFSPNLTWDETAHWYPATCGHDVVAGYEEHTFVNNVCTVCHYVNTNVWPEEAVEIFNEHLYGYNLPFLKGLEVSFDSSNDCVYVTGGIFTVDQFNSYVDKIVADGFTKQAGPYENTYILLKDVVVEGNTKTIDIDIFINDSEITAICYDPFVYSWPGEVVEDLLTNYFYRKPTAQIPSVEADRYFADTSYMLSDALLTISCYSDTNLENTYKSSLIENGFTVSDSKNEKGMFVATEPEEIAEVQFGYSTSEKVLTIVIAPFNAWPALAVDYYTDQLTGGSGTRVPAVTDALSYEFMEDSYDQHGYFSVLCPCEGNLESNYEAKLEAANYTIYNERKNAAGNYWAISENEDLLVQYVYWFNDWPGASYVYEEFDVLFEKYYPYNEEHIAAGLEIIQPGTKTVIPTFPCCGAKVTISDNDVNMFINVQTAYYDSISTYAGTLEDLGWSITMYTEYNYVCVSPDRDVMLKLELVDGRPLLTASAFSDPYNEWPTEGVNEIINSLNLTGDVPVFDGALSYDYENNAYYHDVVCFVSNGKEDQLIETYYQKLVGLGWRPLKDGDYTYYIKDGYTIGLLAYVEESEPGRVYIDISFMDGRTYDLDARNAFIDWKFAYQIRLKTQIPGIDFTEEIVDSELEFDEGETYAGYDLFELIVDFGEIDLSSSLDEVKSQFVTAGWKYSSSNDRYELDDFWMKTYIKNGKLFIDICTRIPARGLLGVMTQFIYDTGYDSFINLPVDLGISEDYTFEVTKYEIGEVIGAEIGLAVKLTFTKLSDASATEDLILNAFAKKGWSKSKDCSEHELVDPVEFLKLKITYVDGSKDVLVEFIDNSGFW